MSMWPLLSSTSSRKHTSGMPKLSRKQNQCARADSSGLAAHSRCSALDLSESRGPERPGPWKRQPRGHTHPRFSGRSDGLRCAPGHTCPELGPLRREAAVDKERNARRGLGQRALKSGERVTERRILRTRQRPRQACSLPSCYAHKVTAETQQPGVGVRVSSVFPTRPAGF